MSYKVGESLMTFLGQLSPMLGEVYYRFGLDLIENLSFS